MRARCDNKCRVAARRNRVATRRNRRAEPALGRATADKPEALALEVSCRFAPPLANDCLLPCPAHVIARSRRSNAASHSSRAADRWGGATLGPYRPVLEALDRELVTQEHCRLAERLRSRSCSRVRFRLPPGRGGGGSPVLEKMSAGRAQSRSTCGGDGPSPSADVDGVSAVPGQMWQRASTARAADLWNPADRGAAITTEISGATTTIDACGWEARTEDAAHHTTCTVHATIGSTAPPNSRALREIQPEPAAPPRQADDCGGLRHSACVTWACGRAHSASPEAPALSGGIGKFRKFPGARMVLVTARSPGWWPSGGCSC